MTRDAASLGPGEPAPEAEWTAALDALDETLASLRDSLDTTTLVPALAELPEPEAAMPVELAERARAALAETRALEERVIDAIVTLKSEFVSSRRDAAGVEPTRPHFIDRHV